MTRPTAAPLAAAAGAGAAAALAGRALLVRAVTAKLRRDLRALNAGDYGPLLDGYADHAVLTFNDGPHRWAGVHSGKPAIERFLAEFVAAGIQGEILDVWMAGAPWAARLAIRFDDRATTPEGERLYANRTVLVVRTRWGRIVQHDDFYEDTGRILEFEQVLVERGRTPATPAGAGAR